MMRITSYDGTFSLRTGGTTPVSPALHLEYLRAYIATKIDICSKFCTLDLCWLPNVIFPTLTFNWNNHVHLMRGRISISHIVDECERSKRCKVMKFHYALAAQPQFPHVAFWILPRKSLYSHAIGDRWLPRSCTLSTTLHSRSSKKQNTTHPHPHIASLKWIFWNISKEVYPDPWHCTRIQHRPHFQFQGSTRHLTECQKVPCSGFQWAQQRLPWHIPSGQRPQISALKREKIV